MDIPELLKSGQPESSTLEYKSTGAHADSIIREIIALANNKGGTIIIGAREEEGDRVEIEDVQNSSRLEENIQNQLATKVEPRTEIEFQTCKYEDKQVVGIVVESYRLLRSVDINNRPVFPIRQGSTTTYLHGMDLARAYAGEGPSLAPRPKESIADSDLTAFEYLNNSSAESREEQVLVLFNYARKYNQDDGITIDELSDLLRDARIHELHELGVMLRDLAKDGKIMSMNTNPARWTITMDGIHNVDSLGSEEGKRRSLTEYYRMADSPTKSDSALIVGWYIEQQEDVGGFTSSEVAERAEEARIQLGANVSRDLSRQIQSANLMKVSESEGRDVYALTLTGEEYVEDQLLNI